MLFEQKKGCDLPTMTIPRKRRGIEEVTKRLKRINSRSLKKVALGSMLFALFPLQLITPMVESSPITEKQEVWQTQLSLADKTPDLMIGAAQTLTIEKGPSRYDEEQERLAQERKKREAALRLAHQSSAVTMTEEEKQSWIAQAAASYGIPRQLLWAVLVIESGGQAYTCKANPVSGATGPGQFMPKTWERYGIDGNKDGRRDKCDIRDVAFGSANLLASNGAAQGDYRRALLRYNNAEWYVRKVLDRAGM